MTSGREALRARLGEELRAYAIAAAYLYVCLGALLLYKGALLREEGVSFLHFGLALGKALILGKFLLIGEAARIGARRRSRTLLHLIVQRVVLLLLLLVVLAVAEEFVAGWIHGRPMAEMRVELGSRSPELLATALLLGLVLVPYVATQEINRALGPGALRRLLLQSPPE
jgi:hypothetical protein